MIGEEPGDWRRGFGGSQSDSAPLGVGSRIERGARGGRGQRLETKGRGRVSKAGLKRQAVRCARFGGPGSLEDRARDGGMKWFRFQRRKFSKCW